MAAMTARRVGAGWANQPSQRKLNAQLTMLVAGFSVPTGFPVRPDETVRMGNSENCQSSEPIGFLTP